MSRSRPVTLETLTAETFEAHRGEPFRLGVDAATAFDAELIEIVRGGDEGAAPRRAPFSVVFRAPSGHEYPQGIYRVEHAHLGVLEIFLVPIGPDEVGMRYEAVFA